MNFIEKSGSNHLVHMINLKYMKFVNLFLINNRWKQKERNGNEKMEIQKLLNLLKNFA